MISSGRGKRAGLDLASGPLNISARQGDRIPAGKQVGPGKVGAQGEAEIRGAIKQADVVNRIVEAIDRGSAESIGATAKAYGVGESGGILVIDKKGMVRGRPKGGDTQRWMEKLLEE